jgi:protein FAM32A
VLVDVLTLSIELKRQSGALTHVCSCRTKAQLQHEQYVAKREAEMLKKSGVKSHRERITEYNQKLSQMTEHNDIPKVGPG